MAEGIFTNMFEREVEDYERLLAGFDKRADCLQTTIKEIAGKDNLSELLNRVEDLKKTVEVEIKEDEKLYNRLIVLYTNIKLALNQ